MRVHILTLFPEAFPGTLGISLIGKALDKGLISIYTYDLKDKIDNDMIDDTPFGGGAGMVIKADTIDQAIIRNSLENTYKVFLSPRGAVLTQSLAQAFTQLPQDLLLLCGRYEGVDQRVLEKWNFHEVSVGDFVLCGGEVAALTVLETCFRLIPGVVGKSESLDNDTFPKNLLEHDQYTKPAVWQDMEVPSVLLSGNHEAVESYRKAQSMIRTQAERPDLWELFAKE